MGTNPRQPSLQLALSPILVHHVGRDQHAEHTFQPNGTSASMRHQRGALWAKWDLHVHTPASLVNNYGGSDEQTWERYLTDLEALPPEFKVLGINDYLFIDGYRRVLEAKQAGRLTNIELLLPVVELRIDKFGGTQGHLSRVNMHVIFSDQVSPDLIQHQFLNALPAKYQLEPVHENLGARWQALPTREALADLGRMVRDSSPPGERARYGNPLLDGFNALNLRFHDVMTVLESHYFKDRILTAVGKAEWWNIRWNDRSVAEKKTIINSVDFVFTASGTAEECERAKRSLEEQGVNSCLLDCSDAHWYSETNDKDRIGNCFSWVNADTEFEGLRQALREPHDRIWLGEEPEARVRVNQNRTKYIHGVTIRKVQNSTLSEPWFDGTELEFNTGLVAIIGNKGSGKSALIDTLGLLGEAQRFHEASFLSEERFRRAPEHKASEFLGELRWEDGRTVRRLLDHDVDRSAPELVTYIPQHLFEDICNELTGRERGKFDQELKRVIFSHVSESERLGLTDLDSLLAYRADEIQAAIEQKRARLAAINDEIIELEQRLAPEHLRSLELQLDQKRAELQAHQEIQPPEVPAPAETPNEATANALARLAQTQELHESVQREIAGLRQRESGVVRELRLADRIAQRVQVLREKFEDFRDQTTPELVPLGLNISDLVILTIDEAPLAAARDMRERERLSINERLTAGTDVSLIDKLESLALEIEVIRIDLDAPHARREAYLAAAAAWEGRRRDIVGTDDEPGTLAYYEGAIRALSVIPTRVNALREERHAVAIEVHGQLRDLADLYSQLYAPVQAFISQHTVARERFDLRFGVSIVNAKFEQLFFDWINRGRIGSFSGTDQGADRIKRLLLEYDFNDSDRSVAFAEAVLDQLQKDYRVPGRPAVSVVDQLRGARTEQSLINFLFGFEYLEPRYELRMGDRELHQLSPGEKGALLLVFYLLVDQNDTPLLIDQPEENLDNQTIYTLLVPSIKAAKRRRQIFIVTHNPNLAVVCDAQQVVCAIRDSHGDPVLRYEAGSIENPSINRRIVDVLEGTKAAFDDRGGKYLA